MFPVHYSFIVATYGRENEFKAVLESIAKQTFRDFEITNENKNDLIIRPEKPAPERDSGSEGVQENNSGN